MERTANSVRFKMKNELVFATANAHKIYEIQTLLPVNIQLLGLEDIQCYEELPETHCTIEENSLEKAKYVFKNYKVDCFAEDSGLEIEALNGEPGVNSAHYSGSRNAKQNYRLVLHNMKGIKNRRAQFKTVFTLIANSEISQYTGIVTGVISKMAKGFNGFGYDPIFVPNGYSITFGEMNPVDKVTISHRSKAFILLKQHLELKFIN